MGDDRLLYVMVLHVHTQLADSLDLTQVANQFEANNDSRKQVFRTFSKRDIPVKKVIVSSSTQKAQ